VKKWVREKNGKLFQMKRRSSPKGGSSNEDENRKGSAEAGELVMGTLLKTIFSIAAPAKASLGEGGQRNK